MTATATTAMTRTMADRIGGMVWLLVVVSPVSSRALPPDSGGCPVLDGRMSALGSQGRPSTVPRPARVMPRVYDRAHADLPRSRGDDSAPPRGPRRDAALPDRVVRQSSSAHTFGRAARAGLDEAHERVARRLNAQGREIVFTSGGTEANNLALKGSAWPARHVVTGSSPRRSSTTRSATPCVTSRSSGSRSSSCRSIAMAGSTRAARDGAQRQDDPRVW
jgi:hypothetical protein